MRPLAPFQIDQNEIDRTSLDQEDLGLWAILVTGCYHLFETRAAAFRAYQLLQEGVTTR